MWQKYGLSTPDSVKEATQQYKEEMDPLKDFIVDCCLVNPLARANNTSLWSEYEDWCKENGEKYPLSRKRFKQKLESRGFKQERAANMRYYVGIGLKTNRKAEAIKERVPGLF